MSDEKESTSGGSMYRVTLKNRVFRSISEITEEEETFENFRSESESDLDSKFTRCSNSQKQKTESKE